HEADERVVVHVGTPATCSRSHAQRTPSGPSTTTTGTSGQCSRCTATNAAAASRNAPRSRVIGMPTFTPMASVMAAAPPAAPPPPAAGPGRRRGWEDGAAGEEPGDGRDHAAHAPEPLADVHRHVHLVRPGHQATERQRAEELVVIEPATLLDEDALRPGRKTAAEAGEGDGEKGE